LTHATCILHAGTEKTGTTSLQRFMAMNAAELAERGVWVPRSLVRDPSEAPYNHMLLTTASRLSVSEPDDLQTALGLSTMEMIHTHRRVVSEALALERSALSYVPTTIIVSNEHIHSRLRSDSDMAYAKALLEPFCSGFRVVVYLRRQDELAQSIAVTAIRQGATEFRSLPDFDTPNGFDSILGVDHEYFDYQQLLQRLEHVFGSEVLDVRLYAREVLAGNDVIEDFFTRAGIEIGELSRPGRENASLSWDAVRFLLKLNGYLQDKPGAQAIRERILAYMALTHYGSTQPSSHADQRRFMALFASSNEAVRSRWFPGRESLFSEPTAGSSQGGEHPALSEADAFKFFIELFGRATES